MAQDEPRSTGRPRTRKQTADKPPAKPRIRAARTKTPADATPDAVAVRAYLLWERGEPGDAVDHWLRAERDLRAA